MIQPSRRCNHEPHQCWHSIGRGIGIRSTVLGPIRHLRTSVGGLPPFGSFAASDRNHTPAPSRSEETEKKVKVRIWLWLRIFSGFATFLMSTRLTRARMHETNPQLLGYSDRDTRYRFPPKPFRGSYGADHVICFHHSSGALSSGRTPGSSWCREKCVSSAVFPHDVASRPRSRA